MQEIPSPLLAAAERRQSQVSSPSISDIVSPVASPPIPQSSAFQRPPPARSGSTSEERLSKLFPTRTPSLQDERRPRPPTKQFSLPTAGLPKSLLPPAPPVYQIPQAPAPPSFSENTSYDRTADAFDTQHAPIEQAPGRTRSILNRITGLRSPKQGSYKSLDDDDNDLGSGRTGRKLRGVTEEDEEASIGYDAGGSYALRSLNKKSGTTRDAIDNEHDLAHAGYAAEYERLEAADRALGSGMDSVVEAPPVQMDSPKDTMSRSKTLAHRRGPSNSNIDAQKTAEETGEILAVPEPPAFDMSNFSGGDIGSMAPLSSNADTHDGDQKKSYYFPEDKDKPNWRPMSLHWSYVGMLIFLALALAGLQEYICQVSLKKAEEGEGILEFITAAELSMTKYFTWKYAPTIILLSYGMLWQITDYECKRLEPFYQLSRKTGATAAESINLDYVSLMSYFVPFQAVRHQHWAVVLSSCSFLMAGSVVPILQSASVNIYPEKDHRRPDELKFVRIDPIWSRAVTAVLGFTALMGVMVLFVTRRKSGLLSDPKGIAGIAAMATRSHILNDFRSLDTAPQSVLDKQLRHRRYILHKSSLWQGEYIRGSNESYKEHHTDSRPLMLTKRFGYPFVALIVAVGVLIPIFMFIPSVNAATESAPWLLTTIATSVKLIWGALDMSMRLMEPWHILSLRKAPASVLTLDYTGTIPGWLFVKALKNKHYMVALVGLGAILTEVLTVCASSFSVDGLKFITAGSISLGKDLDDDDPNNQTNTGETYKSFWVSFALAFAILIYLIAVAVIALQRRSKKIMPRTPGPMASTLAFIHQSRMLDTFIGTEKYDSVQMAKHLEKEPKQYGLGWFNGRDREDHCGIDEEPLLATYEFGVDWTKSRIAGGQVGGWEHF